jgi:hypothetical protein
VPDAPLTDLEVLENQACEHVAASVACEYSPARPGDAFSHGALQACEKVRARIALRREVGAKARARQPTLERGPVRNALELHREFYRCRLADRPRANPWRRGLAWIADQAGRIAVGRVNGW